MKISARRGYQETELLGINTVPMLISYHYTYHYAKKLCPMKKSVQFLRRSRRPRSPEPQNCIYVLGPRVCALRRSPWRNLELDRSLRPSMADTIPPDESGPGAPCAPVQASG